MGSPDTAMQRSHAELIQWRRSHSAGRDEYVLAISSAMRRWDAILIHIKLGSGELVFDKDSDEHVFTDMAALRKHLRKHGRYEVKLAGRVVLGLAIVASYAWVLIATDVDAAPAVQLPGGHCVHNVAVAQWECAPLNVATGNREADLRHGERLTEFPISGYHYFCETADVTRPFPSPRPPSNPSWEFVWNAYLSQPFRRAGLATVVPHLLQGLAERRSVRDLDGTLADLVLIARRSRLHAGTRYKARGINAVAAPANEIECEQLLLLRDQRWAAYVWRRGSVPLRWTQTVKSSGVGTAIAIEPEHTFAGSRRYFRRLQMRYARLGRAQEEYASAEDGDLDSDGGGGKLSDIERVASRALPVAVVNLLRKGSIERDRSEAKLYSAFCGLLAALSTECGLNVINIGLDWHEMAATHGGLAPVVRMLWGASEAHCRAFGFTAGAFVPPPHVGEANSEGGPSSGPPLIPWGPDLCATIDRRQCGVFRFNCADSLDRTNVASYYSAFQVLLEQGRYLGLRFANYRSAAPTAAGSEANGMSAAGGGVASSSATAPRVGSPGGRTVQQKASKMLGTFASRMGSMASGMIASTSNGNLTGPHRRSATAAAASRAEYGSEADVDEAPRSDTDNATAAEPTAAHVPPGMFFVQAADGTWWEKRAVGWPPECPTQRRVVYVNHETRATRWAAPPAWNEWELLRQSVDRLRRLVHAPLLSAYKELFRVSGDRNAELYTGSAAMHSNQLDLLLVDTDGGHGMTGFFNNAHTAVTRRFKNILTDERTHSIFEMTLGLPVRGAPGADASGHGIAYELSAEAQALPICDDDDSDIDVDELAGRAWPPSHRAAADAAVPVPPDERPRSALAAAWAVASPLSEVRAPWSDASAAPVGGGVDPLVAPEATAPRTSASSPVLMDAAVPSPSVRPEDVGIGGAVAAEAWGGEVTAPEGGGFPGFEDSVSEPFEKAAEGTVNPFSGGESYLVDEVGLLNLQGEGGEEEEDPLAIVAAPEVLVTAGVRTRSSGVDDEVSLI